MENMINIYIYHPGKNYIKENKKKKKKYIIKLYMSINLRIFKFKEIF